LADAAEAAPTRRLAGWRGADARDASNMATIVALPGRSCWPARPARQVIEQRLGHRPSTRTRAPSRAAPAARAPTAASSIATVVAQRDLGLSPPPNSARVALAAKPAGIVIEARSLPALTCRQRIGSSASLAASALSARRAADLGRQLAAVEVGDRHAMLLAGVAAAEQVPKMRRSDRAAMLMITKPDREVQHQSLRTNAPKAVMGCPVSRCASIAQLMPGQGEKHVFEVGNGRSSDGAPSLPRRPLRAAPPARRA